MLAAGLAFGDLAAGGAVTCVGGGAGSLPMALLQAFPELAVDVVEIDPVVAQAAATFLGLRARGGGPPEEAFLRGLRPPPSDSASARDPPAAACRLWLRDAAAHLARAPPGSQAAVFVDAFDRDNEVPPQLAAPAFFADCLAALRPGGPLVWNTQFDFEAAPSLEEHCARELALAAVPAGSVGEVSSSPPRSSCAGMERGRRLARVVVSADPREPAAAGAGRPGRRRRGGALGKRRLRRPEGGGRPDGRGRPGGAVRPAPADPRRRPPGHRRRARAGLRPGPGAERRVPEDERAGAGSAG